MVPVRQIWQLSCSTAGHERKKTVRKLPDVDLGSTDPPLGDRSGFVLSTTRKRPGMESWR